LANELRHRRIRNWRPRAPRQILITLVATLATHVSAAIRVPGNSLMAFRVGPAGAGDRRPGAAARQNESDNSLAANAGRGPGPRAPGRGAAPGGRGPRPLPRHRALSEGLAGLRARAAIGAG
jgi:hypothetical protein